MRVRWSGVFRPTSRAAEAQAAVAVASLLVVGLMAWYLDLGAKMAPGVSQESLLLLRPGMTEAEIVELLGEPLSRKLTPFPELWDWSYSIPSPLTGGGLEISLGVRSGRLEGAGVEHYDLGVYWCHADACPIVWNRSIFDRIPHRRSRR